MNNLSEKKSMRILGGMGLLCFVLLSVFEYRAFNASYEEDWRIAFVNPIGQDLLFQVENDTENTNFHYVIFARSRPVSEGDISVLPGKARMFSVGDLAGKDVALEGKILIRIESSSGGDREIYKTM